MNGIVSKVALGVAGTGMAVAVAAVAVGPRVSDWYEDRHREQVSYASGSQAKADRRSVPSWLPDDASGVRYLMSTAGGDRLLRATLPDGRLPAGCTRDAVAGAPERARPVAPRLRAAWFPAEAADRPTGSCGHYRVSLAGDQLYAWQDGAAVQAALRAERQAATGGR